MHRLFLDANILFSAAYRADAGLVQFCRLKNTTLCSSRYALEEARTNLAENAQRHRLLKLARHVHFFDAAPRQRPTDISLPEKDVPIFLAAIEASRHISLPVMFDISVYISASKSPVFWSCHQLTTLSGTGDDIFASFCVTEDCES